MKLLFLLGSRGEWGYIKPIIDICRIKKIKYSICATNMVLLPSYGLLINEIKNQKYNVDYEIDMALEGSNHFTMAKSLGIFFTSFVDILKRSKINWLILAGDRGEQLMGAVAAAYAYIPVAHIQAGERSGNIDGVTRHAISKFCHLHFASNKDAEARLIKMGEEKFRVKNVGAPQIDDMIHNHKNLDHLFIKKKFNIDINLPYALVLQHPVTEEFNNIEMQINILINSLKIFKYKKIWILPNIDAGSEIIKNELLNKRSSETIIFKNISREIYLFLLKNSSFIIGNSSSGILEAPTYKVPAINIGRRQKDRIQGKNVINCEFIEKEIKKAIKQSLSKSFKKKIKNCINLYGDGKSSTKIIDILFNTKVDQNFLIKKQTY
jgi:GDP/UDP-N,N'-diacetylbacillosamine 2-epimerase (hydrolysing)